MAKWIFTVVVVLLMLAGVILVLRTFFAQRTIRKTQGNKAEIDRLEFKDIFGRWPEELRSAEGQNTIDDIIAQREAALSKAKTDWDIQARKTHLQIARRTALTQGFVADDPPEE